MTTTDLTTVFARATRPGPSVGPAAAIALAAAPGFRPGNLGALTTAIEADLPFLPLAPFRKTGPVDEARWAEALRWLVADLSTPTQSRCLAKLSAPLALIHAMERTGPVWPQLTPLIGSCPDVAALLTSVLKASHVTTRAPAQAVASQEFLANDQALAWDAMGVGMATAFDFFNPPWLIGAAARGLAAIDLPSLVAAARPTNIFEAAAVSEALDTEDATRLAEATPDERLRFALTHGVTGNRIVVLTPNQQNRLAAMLGGIVGAPDRWAVWMRCFARYPAAYPSLQLPLGLALGAAAPDAAVAYIGALPVDLSDPKCRLLAATTFEAFAGLAPLVHRQAVWNEAHDRWSKATLPPSSRSLPRSVLDFAIVGYGLEVLSAQDLQARVLAQQAVIAAPDARWHSSSGDARQAWCGAFARSLPFARALEAPALSDWLDRSPLELATGSYHALRYR